MSFKYKWYENQLCETNSSKNSGVFFKSNFDFFGPWFYKKKHINFLCKTTDQIGLFYKKKSYTDFIFARMSLLDFSGL